MSSIDHDALILSTGRSYICPDGDDSQSLVFEMQNEKYQAKFGTLVFQHMIYTKEIPKTSIVGSAFRQKKPLQEVSLALKKKLDNCFKDGVLTALPEMKVYGDSVDLDRAMVQGGMIWALVDSLVRFIQWK